MHDQFLSLQVGVLPRKAGRYDLCSHHTSLPGLNLLYFLTFFLNSKLHTNTKNHRHNIYYHNIFGYLETNLRLDGYRLREPISQPCKKLRKEQTENQRHLAAGDSLFGQIFSK